MVIKNGNFKIILFFIVLISLMSTFMLNILDRDEFENKKENKQETKMDPNYLKENNDGGDVVGDEQYFPGGFKANKKYIVLEKEIIKEVVKEVCTNIKEQENEILEKDSKNKIINRNDYFKFKDERSILNYFLTYQYYYQFENYKNVQYIDNKKYRLSDYEIPSVDESTHIYKSIEYWNEEIGKINNTFNVPSNLHANDLLNSEYNEKYFNLVLHRVKALVYKQFYFNYNQYTSFNEFARSNGINIAPPRLQLPLDTSKPLLTTPYLFLHMPKTGGHTIYSHYQSLFRGNGIVRQWTYPNPKEYERVRSATNFVLGHFEYGIHNELVEPQKSTYSYLTMLRDPVDRVISHYYYHRNTVLDGEHPLAAALPLGEWIRQSPRGRNEQTRVLSGITTNEEPTPTNETLNLALFHLRTMKFVGLTERFEETLALLKFFTGLENPSVYEKQNSGRKPQQEVPQTIIDEIKRLNWMDIILYEEATRMFQRQIDIVGYDNFQTQLKKIQPQTPQIQQPQNQQPQFQQPQSATNHQQNQLLQKHKDQQQFQNIVNNMLQTK